MSNYIKKILLIGVVIGALVLALPRQAGAQGNGIGTLNFDNLNTTIHSGTDPVFGQMQGYMLSKALYTPRGIISFLLPFLFTMAGLILFIMILWGGFEMLTGAANPKSQEAGKQRITSALIGFLIIFSSYWLAKILEILFGISILGG